MTDTETPQPTPYPQSTPVPRARRRGSAVALVASGLLAGGVLAGTLSASAQTGADDAADPRPCATAADERQSRQTGETLLEGDTATQVEAAVLAEHPDATILRLETDADGAYEAHILTADGEHVVVAVDESFTVTGSVTAPQPGPRGGHGPRGGGPVPGATDEGTADDATAQTSGLDV